MDVAIRLCPVCGASNPVDRPKCASCGATIPLVSPGFRSAAVPPGAAKPQAPTPGTTGPYPTRGPPPTSRALRNTLLVIAAGVVVLLILGIVFVLVPKPFSLAVPAGGCVPQRANFDFPFGAQVVFHWRTDSGQPLAFSIQDPAGNVVYSEVAANGSGSFTATGGAYAFSGYSCSPDSIRVSGSYTG